MARFGFCGGTYQSESVNADAQRCINWYPEINESQAGASQMMMYPRWGQKPFCTLAGSAVRGLYEFSGRMFGVGSNFAEIMADGTVVGYGFLPVDANPVSMAANNANQLIICTGGQLWLFPLASGAIIYTNVPANISAIQIHDNADPSVKDYYITCTTAPPWTVGTTLTIAGVTALPFLNGVTGTIVSIAGNVVHLQLPRSLTLNYPQNIASVTIAANAAVNSLLNAGAGTALYGTGWVNPNNIAGGSPSFAVFPVAPNVSPGMDTDKLATSLYGFSIPAGATILGIEVAFFRQITGTHWINHETDHIRLLKAGVAAGSTVTGPGTQWTTSAVQEVYGGPTNLWGTSWTPSDINNAGFGFDLDVFFETDPFVVSHDLQVRGASIKVYYQTFNGKVTLSATCLFTAGNTVVLSGMTSEPALNGTQTMTSIAGAVITLAGTFPGPAFSGAETGTAKGELVNYGPTADTGTVTGNVISYGTAPVQVATTYGPFQSVDFVDGRFIALAKNTQNVYYSAFEDGTTWTGEYFRVSQYAENVIAMLVNRREIWLWSEKHTTVYANTGDLNNPFAPIDGAYIEAGIAGPWCAVRMDNSVFWIVADERGFKVGMRAQGLTPQRVSTHAIEAQWNKLGNMADVISYSIQHTGHVFWHLHFPSDNVSYRYDAATNMWSEPLFLMPDGEQVAHRSRCHAMAFGKQLLGDTGSGVVFVTDQTQVTDDVPNYPQNPIRRVRRAPHITSELEWEFHHKLRLHLETGLGPVNELPTVATGFPYLFLQDANGNNWQVQINDNGTTTSTSLGTGTAPAVMLFADIALLPSTVTVYTLGVDLAGNLTLILAPGIFSGYYTRLAAMTTPSALQTYFSVQYGAILIETPLSATRDPQVMLRYSDDGGHTWSNEYAVGAGMAGEFTKVVEWRRLGRSRDRVYEVAVSDPIPWRIIDAYLFSTPRYQPTERYPRQLAKQA